MKNVIKTIGIFLAFCAYIATIYTATYYFTLWLFEASYKVVNLFMSKKEAKTIPASEEEATAAC